MSLFRHCFTSEPLLCLTARFPSIHSSQVMAHRHTHTHTHTHTLYLYICISISIYLYICTAFSACKQILYCLIHLVDLPSMQNIWAWSLPWEVHCDGKNPLQYSWLAIPWTDEPGRLQSMGSQRQMWLSIAHTHTHTYITLREFTVHVNI